MQNAFDLEWTYEHHIPEESHLSESVCTSVVKDVTIPRPWL